MGKGKPSAIVTFYLFLYNIASCAGWLMVLLICIKHIKDQTLDSLWTDVSPILKIVQTAAVFEILHSMIGFVKSPWVTTLMQVFSRVWTLWAIMDISVDAQTSIFMTLACTSWGLVEVPRYLFYALNLFDAVPYPIFWLRYSLFAILYPTGITGEVGCMYYAGKYLYESKAYTWRPIPTMPQVELSLFMAVVFVVVTYLPGSPKMYMHMVKTRKKQFAELKSHDQKVK